MSSRGRKRNDNLPPSRAREVQRAFRAQCPPQTNACSPPERQTTTREGLPDESHPVGASLMRPRLQIPICLRALLPRHYRPALNMAALPPQVRGRPRCNLPNGRPTLNITRPRLPDLAVSDHLPLTDTSAHIPRPVNAQNQGTEVLRSIIERDQGPIPTFAFNVPKQQSSILPNPADRAPY
ncbi:hypothetical protein RhiXN_05715 [Rhizoctonia solani]|uniref:Uncharacterized protein n=1 Tax=Rhizoctonia solani TaxID=456999 RepID=A0A8H8SW73_9AGAM|nr:uncharacterized protein RhiXN_05715 [Rhizoctonia solani]QRW20726.1 hypothetical protein RhiXN_05715 [Rhizoctonia solani]